MGKKRMRWEPPAVVDTIKVEMDDGALVPVSCKRCGVPLGSDLLGVLGIGLSLFRGGEKAREDLKHAESLCLNCRMYEMGEKRS